MIRRRPVRPFFGARERIAVFTLVAALAASVHIGDMLADVVSQAGWFADLPVTELAIDGTNG